MPTRRSSREPLAPPVQPLGAREALAAFASLAAVVVAMWGGTLGIALHQDDYWQAGGVGSPWRLLSAGAVRAMWSIAGPSPAPYHAVILLAHAVATWLVFVLARRLGARGWIAWAASAAFAASATHAYVLYSVVTAAEAPAAAFVLVAAIAWMDGRIAWSVAAFACALACKESVALLAPAFALLPRTGGGAAGRSRWWLALHCAIAAAWLAFVSVTGGLNEQVWARLYQPASAGEAVTAFTGYVTGALDVLGLRVDPYHNVPHPAWAAVIGAALVLTIAALRSRGLRGPIVLGVVWFTLAIGPFTTTRSMFMLYYLYAPLAGIAAAAAWAAERTRVAPAAALAACAVLIAGSTWSLQRTETARLGGFDVHAQSSLRHAQIARNVLASVGGAPLGERVMLVFPRRYPAVARPNRGWFDRNLFVAISDGRALVLTCPRLRHVEPLPRTEEPPLDWTRVHLAWDGTARAVIAPAGSSRPLR